MYKRIIKLIIISVILALIPFKTFSQTLKEIKIYGNERISDQTIIVFSKAEIGNQINENDLNTYLKNLYETNFFKNVNLKLEGNVLFISVEEEPLIQNVIFNGIKANKILDPIKSIIILKDRSSFKENLFLIDKKRIKENLKLMGYYFSDISGSIEDLGDNRINLIYDINLGEKAKISKITFTGNKVFKDKKLRNIIASEEYKFWKFISGKKFLNESLIDLDNKLLRNFYLNNGYYNVEINSSFAKLLSNSEFELVFNINANKKYYFENLELKISDDYDKDNFKKIFSLFRNLKGTPYSINSIDNVLELIDEIVISEQYESINATVNETVIDNRINMVFEVKETEKFFIERINIFGNNVTEEKVIRNQLLVDEGDPYNEILNTKSLNNIRSLNFFKTVKSDVLNSNNNNKIINITVEEKATGEIVAGAGVGTEGSTIMFGIKENNFLGKGISLDSQLKLSEEDIKGNFTVLNPNFNNSDKSLFFNVQTLETDRMSTSGYKTNKSGFKFGTEFEYYNDFNIGLASSNFYEKISTDSTASVRQQKQKEIIGIVLLILILLMTKEIKNFKHLEDFIQDIILIYQLLAIQTVL